MPRKITLEFIACLLILLFVYTAGSKLLDMERFRLVISKSPLLYPITGFVAIVIPLSEFLVSILIALPRYRYAGMLGAFSLMVIFTAYIFAILQFSENIPCACGGVLQSLGWQDHLIFNIGFTLVALLGVVLSANHKEKEFISNEQHK